MKPENAPAPSADDSGDTGLPWPRTWRGVYLFVIGSFVVWVGLLIVLTELFS